MSTAEMWRDYLYFIEKDFYSELMGDKEPASSSYPPDIMVEKVERAMRKLWERTEERQRQRIAWDVEQGVKSNLEFRQSAEPWEGLDEIDGDEQDRLLNLHDPEGRGI